MPKINITIDGPSGSGKSTISRKFAEKIGISFLDSGSIYRIIAYYFHHSRIKLTDSEIQKNLCKINLVFSNGVFLLNGFDLGERIRTREITNFTSKIAQNKIIREFATDLQRNIVSKGGFVLDGRDAGTNVIPNAGLKFWLTASLEERATRRYNEFITNKDSNLTYDEIYRDLGKRDKFDESRTLNPLKLSFDMIIIDTTKMTISEVLESMKSSYFAIIRHPFRINKNFSSK